MFLHHKSVRPGFDQNRFRRRNVGRLVIACLRATALIIIASNALFLFFKATLRRITSLMQLFKCTSAEKAERNSAAIMVFMFAILKFQISRGFQSWNPISM